MANGEKILIVDDDASNRRILEQELAHRGYKVDTAGDGAEALGKIDRSRPALVILDYMMPGLSGLDVLNELRRREEDIPVIMITAYSTVDRAVEAMRAGAYDFITKPFEPDHIELVLRKAIDRHTLKRKVDVLNEEDRDRYQMIVGNSANMKLAVEMAEKAAASAATVLLVGESGTGKELFARFIHNHSARSQRPFIAINSVGLSPELLESDLFGHEQGAFTGANKLKKGKIELANGGTVFFDEIGDISRALQAKLLRFLQEREFERVGGVTPISVDVRIIAATNRDLAGAVRNGEFRQDLYHRLNVVAITPPPLRERKEDIALLAEHFLTKFGVASGRKVSGISQGALARLADYDWPGNVRELANVIERAVVLGSARQVGVTDLPTTIRSKSEEITIPDDLSYREAVNATRKLVVEKALAATHGNKTAAAKLLKLEAKYFLRLLSKLGMN